MAQTNKKSKPNKASGFATWRVEDLRFSITNGDYL